MNTNILIAIVVVLALALGFGGAGNTGSTARSTSDADELLLARLIDVEARGESYRGKVAVGAVVVNRRRDPRFPNTVRAVIYEPGQFYVAGLRHYPNPSRESRRAAAAALRGEDPTRGALFFYNPDKARTTRWWASRPQQMRIGNHVFSQ